MKERPIISLANQQVLVKTGYHDTSNIIKTWLNYSYIMVAFLWKAMLWPKSLKAIFFLNVLTIGYHEECVPIVRTYIDTYLL